MADDLLREAVELFGAAQAADQQNQNDALADFEFMVDQWPPDWRRSRDLDKRPVLQVNQLPMFARQIVNDARIKSPSITVRPADSGADVKTAEMLTGLIRNIEAVSQAEIAYIRALEHAVIGGMGHFRILPEPSTDDGWDMDLRVRPIYSPHSVTWDHGARHPLRIDADFVFITDMITRRQFEHDYPDASPSDWSSLATATNTWITGESVRIAEYWRKKAIKRKLLLLKTGETIDAGKLSADDVGFLRESGAVERERTVDAFEIRSVKMTSHEVLSDEVVFPGKCFPIVPVLGEEVQIGDRAVRCGIVRNARDPQFLYNVHTSTLAESILMSTKAKWIGTDKNFAKHAETWEQAHLSNFPFIPYTPDPANGNVAPQRIAPEIPNQQLLAQLGMMTQDLQRTIGIFQSGLGQEDNSKSGKAILVRQKEGDISTFHYVDNLTRAVEHCGRILVDIIPSYYDTARQVRVLGEDGSSELVPVNTMMPGGQVVHDLSRGKYDVVAQAGPSFSTKREESRESMLALMQAVPQAASVIMDLYVKANDWPMADEIARRLRLMLPPGLAKPEPDDPPPRPQPPSPEQMIAQAEVTKAQTAQQKAQFDAQFQAQKMEMDSRLHALEAQLKIVAAVLQEKKLQLDAAEALQAGIKAEHGMRNDDARLQLDAANKMVTALSRGQQGSPGRAN